MKKTILILTASCICLFMLAYTQITVFVIPPIGAMPEGKTLIISKLNNSSFIESPDAICNRIQGGVSILCRGMTIGKIVSNSKIYLRLPYFDFLYNLSIA